MMLEALAIFAITIISSMYAVMVLVDEGEKPLVHLLLNIIFAIAVAYLVSV